MTSLDERISPEAPLSKGSYTNLTDEEPDSEVKMLVFPHGHGRKRLIEEFRQAHQEFKDTDTRVYTYSTSLIGSRSQMGLLGDWAPSVVFAMNHFHGTHYPYREAHLHEYAYSKLAHLSCTLFKGLMFGYSDFGTAQSKVRNLRSVSMNMHYPELAIPEEELTEENFPRMIFEVGLTLSKMVAGLVEQEHLYDAPKVKKAESHNLAYVDELKRRFGSRLRSVMLYGSSARGEGSDYDNIVILDRLSSEDFDLIYNNPLYEGKKEVGVVFVEEASANNFFYINVSNPLFREQSKVLYGEISLPREDRSYSRRKEQYHAGYGSSKLISGMNLAFKHPEIFSDKPGLFDYFAKLNRFTLSGLKQQDFYHVITKDKLYTELRERYGYDLNDILGSPKEVLEARLRDHLYVQNILLEANVVSAEIARRMYNQHKTSPPDVEEYLFKVAGLVNSMVARCDFEGLPLLILRRKEKISSQDILPVRVYRSDDPLFPKFDAELKRRMEEGNLPEQYFIGERL